jgi:hypothetical protein
VIDASGFLLVVGSLYADSDVRVNSGSVEIFDTGNLGSGGRVTHLRSFNPINEAAGAWGYEDYAWLSWSVAVNYYFDDFTDEATYHYAFGMPYSHQAGSSSGRTDVCAEVTYLNGEIRRWLCENYRPSSVDACAVYLAEVISFNNDYTVSDIKPLYTLDGFRREHHQGAAARLVWRVSRDRCPLAAEIL